MKCDHSRAKRDSSVWKTWPFVGIQLVVAGPDPVEEPAYELELRNCPTCPTTLSLVLGPDGEPVVES